MFGRTRYRIRGGLVAGAQYKVTNPYGVDTLVAGDDSTIFVTDDVGVGSGNFGAPLRGPGRPVPEVGRQRAGSAGGLPR